MNTINSPLNSVEDILALFEATGISNPTEIQTNNVVALLNKTIPDVSVFLRAGIETAESIQRWRGLHHTMKTIDTVWEHQDRVTNMIPLCYDGIITTLDTFDFKKAGFMAKHHDMTEWLSPFGDIPTPLKLKLSPKLGTLLKKVESACLEILATMDNEEYKIDYHSVREILFEMENKQTPESQVVKYFDLLDAYMMSIHEYILWTTEFLERVEWYQKVFQKIYRGDYLPFLQEIQISNNNSQNQNQNCFSAYHFLDTKTLSTLPIDPHTLVDSFAYKLWQNQIVGLL
jgi:5'-deoxynucleotidase YfbR-like HD superfamily hydrolase